MEKELLRVVRRKAVVGAALIFLGTFIIRYIVSALVIFVFPFFFRLITGHGENLESAGLLTDENYRHLIAEWFSMIVSVICILWCGYLYRCSEWRQKADYRKVFGKRHIIQIFFIGFCGCFFAIMVLTILQKLFPSLFTEYQKNMGDFNTGSVWMLLYTLLLGPVAEELIFRGAVFDRLYLAFPFWAANFLQALLFGVYHGNMIQGIYAFLFGLLLGMLHHTGGSIWNNILAHILFNLTNFIVPAVFRATERGSATVLVLAVLFGFFGFFCGVVSLFREIDEVKKRG